MSERLIPGGCVCVGVPDSLMGPGNQRLSPLEKREVGLTKERGLSRAGEDMGANNCLSSGTVYQTQPLTPLPPPEFCGLRLFHLFLFQPSSVLVSPCLTPLAPAPARGYPPNFHPLRPPFCRQRFLTIASTQRWAMFNVLCTWGLGQAHFRTFP